MMMMASSKQQLRKGGGRNFTRFVILIFQRAPALFLWCTPMSNSSLQWWWWWWDRGAITRHFDLPPFFFLERLKKKGSRIGSIIPYTRGWEKMRSKYQQGVSCHPLKKGVTFFDCHSHHLLLAYYYYTPLLLKDIYFLRAGWVRGPSFAHAVRLSELVCHSRKKKLEGNLIALFTALKINVRALVLLLRLFPRLIS